MGTYDSTFRAIAAARPGDVAWLVLGRDVPARALDTDLQVVVRLEIDSAIRLTPGGEDPFLLNAECELRAKADLSGRLLEYGVLFRRQHEKGEGEDLPVLSGAVILTRSGPDEKGPARQVVEHRVSVSGEEPLVSATISYMRRDSRRRSFSRHGVAKRFSLSSPSHAEAIGKRSSSRPSRGYEPPCRRRSGPRCSRGCAYTRGCGLASKRSWRGS